MVRKDPLDQAIQAYRSSKVFAENQAKQGVGESLLGKGKKSARVLEDFTTEDETEPGPTDSLLGKDKDLASAESVAPWSRIGGVLSNLLPNSPSSKVDQK